ncbi:MAG: hypothetical protein HY869_16575 [Chloroflexi bacterium]|nr:hypothetical protein [Chloroflexota bacterium]
MPNVTVPTLDIQPPATQVVPVATQVIPPTAQVDVQPTAEAGETKLLSDSFESRSSNWGVGTDTDYEVQYVDDALQFKVTATNMKVYSRPNGTSYTDVHIEVDAANQGSDPNAALGVFCNQQVIDDQFYFGYVTPSGEYGIVKSVFINDDVELTSGKSDLIPQNAPSYHIGFDCAANGTMTLYVNGQQVATASDTEYPAGLVGVIAWSGEVESGTIVSFDNYVLTKLP